MIEHWLPVTGLEGRYSVSSLGRVRSDRKNLLMKVQHTRTRYPTISLSWPGSGGNINTYVHALVAVAFLGPRPDGAQINHKDGDKRNASVANLEYVSPSENAIHAFRTGLRRYTPRKVVAISHA